MQTPAVFCPKHIHLCCSSTTGRIDETPAKKRMRRGPGCRPDGHSLAGSGVLFGVRRRALRPFQPSVPPPVVVHQSNMGWEAAGLGTICTAVGLVCSQTSPNTSKACHSSRINPPQFIRTDPQLHCAGHGAPSGCLDGLAGWLAGWLAVPVGQVSISAEEQSSRPVPGLLVQRGWGEYRRLVVRRSSEIVVVLIAVVLIVVAVVAGVGVRAKKLRESGSMQRPKPSPWHISWPGASTTKIKLFVLSSDDDRYSSANANAILHARGRERSDTTLMRTAPKMYILHVTTTAEIS